MQTEIDQAEPTSPLVLDHGDTRTVEQGQQPAVEGLSELEQFKRDRGYTKAPEPVKDPEPPPQPEAAAEPTPPKEEKKAERWQDPDTGDHYDMRHRVSRRVKTLLSERGEARGRAERAEAEVARLTQALITRGDTPAQAEKKAEQIVDQDPEPDPSDLQRYPEGQFDKAFMRDMGRWAARQETKTQIDQVSTRAHEQQVRAQFDATVEQWNQSLPEARKKYEDFDQVLASFPRVPENAPVTDVMFTSPVGNDVVYILGKNANARQAYASARTDRDRYRVLYHIEAKLMEASRAAAHKTQAATTQAPPPTEPVHAGVTAAQQTDWSRSDDADQLARWKALRGSRR